MFKRWLVTRTCKGVGTGPAEEAVVTEADMERHRCFDALFREHVAGIASYCRWQLRSAGDVDDAVAEVFLVAWRRHAAVQQAPFAIANWRYASAPISSMKSDGNSR
jgi:DNA-directed RNA polymerase specialized sigma24 family protein